MAVELLTTLAALFPSLRPVFVSQPVAVASAALVVLIWASTGLIQVPLHDQLGANPAAETVRHLVLSNWLRTVLWSARAVLLTVVLLRVV
jgi:hypothetical protein